MLTLQTPSQTSRKRVGCRPFPPGASSPPRPGLCGRGCTCTTRAGYGSSSMGRRSPRSAPSSRTRLGQAVPSTPILCHSPTAPSLKATQFLKANHNVEDRYRTLQTSKACALTVPGIPRPLAIASAAQHFKKKSSKMVSLVFFCVQFLITKQTPK